MSMVSIGFVELLVIFFMGGAGVGVPLGVPPGPEDPALWQVAPGDCLFYTTWSGTTQPDGESANRTEQLFAEPEVQRLLQEVERIGKQLAAKAAERAPESGAATLRAMPGMAKTLLSRPGALFLERLDLDEGAPDASGALIISLGDATEQAKEFVGLLERHLPSTQIEAVEIGELPFDRVQVSPLRRGPSVPELPLTWGFKDSYLIIGVGSGSVEGVLKRLETPPPAWLTGLSEEFAVTRRATFTYLNLQGLVTLAATVGGPDARRALDAFGISALESYATCSGLDEAGFRVRSLLRTSDPATGITQWLSGRPLEAADLEPIPQTASMAVAARLDLAKLLDGVVAAMEQVNPQWAAQMNQALGELDRRLGLSIRDDLLASLGDSWTVHTTPESGGLLAGWTVTVRLKDKTRFERVHNQLLGFVRGVFAQQRRAPRITTGEFKGQPIHSLSVPEPEFLLMPTWSIVGDRLVITPLPQTMKAFLSRDPETPSLAAHPALAPHLTEAAAPLVITYQDTRAQVELFYPVLQYAVVAASKGLARQGIEVDPSALPSLAAILPHLEPNVTIIRRTERGFESTSFSTYPGASLGASAPLLVALGLPAVQSSRAAARRAQSVNNLKQIALALHNYHDVYRGLPPAYIADANGKPLLSWRVLILPFIEQQGLYEQFRLDEPWDSPHNKRLSAQMPSVFRSPASQAAPNKTVYLGNASARGVFIPPVRTDDGKALPIGARFRDIRDGTSNTIAVLEVGDEKAVVWTKPDDFKPDEDNPLAGVGGLHPGGFNAALCDGSVRFIADTISKRMFQALLTRDAGEVVNAREF